MTTTPAPTDHDTLKALIEDADLPSPIQMDYRFDPELECVIGVMAAGGGVEARIYTEETARLIEAALNQLPALLDELAALKATCTCATTYATYEGPEADCAVHGAVRAFNEAVRERDAAREELAKTRAELDAMTERRNEVRELAAKREAELIYLRAEITTWKRKAAKLREQLGNAKARISAAATVEVWTNEDGKRFVFADDVMAALDPNPEANPATTAEPAVREVTLAEAAMQARINLVEAEQRRIAQDEPSHGDRSTCATCGQPIHYLASPIDAWWAHDVHPADGHDAEPADEPKPTCGAEHTTVIYPIKQPTTVVCTAHEGKRHVNALTGFSWLDAEPATS